MQQYPNVQRLREQMANDPMSDFYPQEKQQYLLYAASNDVFSPDLNPTTRAARPKGITLAKARRLVERVQRSSYARDHWPKFYGAPLTTVDNDVSVMENSLEFIFRAVSGGEKRFTGAYTDLKPVSERTGPATIHLSDNGFAMQPEVVLHELAHAVEGWENGFRENGHDANFARTNVDIIREFLSPEKGQELEQAFDFAGVKVAPALAHPHISLR